MIVHCTECGEVLNIPKNTSPICYECLCLLNSTATTDTPVSNEYII